MTLKQEENTIGKTGEKTAADFLKKNKYLILERNFRTRNGEIDIVAIDKSEKDHVLAFVEVKTRSSDVFGTPFEAITPWKLKFLIRAAQFYKLTHKNLPGAMRIDAVSVELHETGEPEIELMKNISG